MRHRVVFSSWVRAFSSCVCVCIAGFILCFIVPSFLALYSTHLVCVCVYWRFVAHRVHVWFPINSIKLHYISHACVLCRILFRIHATCSEERQRALGQQHADAARAEEININKYAVWCGRRRSVNTESDQKELMNNFIIFFFNYKFPLSTLSSFLCSFGPYGVRCAHSRVEIIRAPVKSVHSHTYVLQATMYATYTTCAKMDLSFG